MSARVLFVVNTGEFGGLERHLLELTFRVDAMGALCTILSYGPDFYTQRLGLHPGIQVVSTPQGDQDSRGGYLSRFRAMRPRVIVFEKGNLNAFPLTAFVAARLCGARVVVIEQLLPEPLPPPVAIANPWDYVRRLAGYRTRVKWMNRLMAGFVNRTICVSVSIRNRLVDEYGFSAKNTITIANGVQLETFQSPSTGSLSPDGNPSLADTHQSLSIVCVSRLVPRKRIGDVLAAFAQITARHPSCRLLIVGAGPEDARLRARSGELGIASAVTFVGYVENVRPYLATATMFVTASENEGLPFSLIEAMASGLPCIATDILGHRDAIRDGHDGILVPLGSVTKLAEAMESLLADAAQGRRLGESGRNTVRQHFDADKNLARIAAEILSGT